jgi:hypothetical protein
VRLFLKIAVPIYLLVAAALLLGLIAARRLATQDFTTADARQAWDIWREDAASDDDHNAPVQRSVPRSSEPPTLVLLRDHFAICAIAGLTLTTVLYWTTAFFIRGAIAGPSFEVERRDLDG